jgi:putative ABC transport system permease protein
LNLVEAFRIAINSLVINRLRTALTTLGIIIGVGAVIGLVSLGRGVEDWVQIYWSSSRPAQTVPHALASNL